MFRYVSAEKWRQTFKGIHTILYFNITTPNGGSHHNHNHDKKSHNFFCQIEAISPYSGQFCLSVSVRRCFDMAPNYQGYMLYFTLILPHRTEAATITITMIKNHLIFSLMVVYGYGGLQIQENLEIFSIFSTDFAFVRCGAHHPHHPHQTL